MRRRDFITLFGGAAAAGAWPFAARAQRSERVRRIGILVNGLEADVEMTARVAAFRKPKRTSLGLLLDPFLSTSESCYDFLSEPRGRQ